MGNDGNIIRISPDGTKMVCLYDSLGEYGNFNTVTGQFTPLFLFMYYYNPTLRGGSEESFAEFSMDSKFLYIIAQNNSNHCNVIQYDAKKTDSLQFDQSATLIYTSTTLDYGGLQMGPDGHIYCVDYTPYVSIIRNPSLQGAACNFQYHAINLLGNNGIEGLCQFVQEYKAYINTIGQCQGNPFSFHAISGRLPTVFIGISVILYPGQAIFRTCQAHPTFIPQGEPIQLNCL